MIKVLAFDFDGVLVESVSEKADAFRDLFLSYGNDIANEALAYHCENPGVYRAEKIQSFYSKCFGKKMSQEELDKKLLEFADIAFNKVVNAPFVLGVKEFFEAKPSLNCYVVSAAPQDELRVIMKKRNLESYFVGIYGGPKKKTELLNQIAAFEKCKSQEVLFVGDSISDWKASKAVGSAFIGRVQSIDNNPFPRGVSTINSLTELPCFVELT